MKINHPSELKCPFCSSKMEYEKVIETDGFISVSLDCEGDNSIICGISIEFGTFGKGVKDRDIDEIVVNLINRRKM